MSKKPVVLADPETGEILTAKQVRALAAEFNSSRIAIREAEEELTKMRAAHSRANAALQAAGLQPGDSIAISNGRWFVVMIEEQKRGQERVSAKGCEKHVEELIGIGLGSMKFAPPTAAEVKASRAALAVAGIPFRDIIPEPTTDYRHEIKVVKLGEETA